MSAPVVRHPMDVAAEGLVANALRRVARAYEEKLPIASLIAAEATGALSAAADIATDAALLGLIWELRMAALVTAAEQRVAEETALIRVGTAAMCRGAS